MGRCGAGPGATHDKASNNPSKATSRIRKCDHRVESNRGNLSCWGTLFLNPQNASQVTKLWVEKSSGKHHEFCCPNVSMARR
jgi:hypothetical protein